MQSITVLNYYYYYGGLGTRLWYKRIPETANNLQNKLASMFKLPVEEFEHNFIAQQLPNIL